jgi:glycosyltransferase involved in cell wall biosynthesis
VSRLILVDDASSDNTPQVAKVLVEQFPGVIQYIRNPSNRKQAFSKNRGKALANTEFVYFGDDDSLLVAGSLSALMETSRKYGADIVGAAALYCVEGEDPEDAYARFSHQEAKEDALDFVDLKRLRFCFSRRPRYPIQVPVTHAAVLARREWYQRIDFDVQYTGNCFREETDFLLQASSSGARIFLDGRAVQINLPRSASTGGARSSGRIRYEWYSLVNTWRFLQKHRQYYHNELGAQCVTPLFWYLWDRCLSVSRRIARG